MNCVICKRWEIAPDDVYCAWCGAHVLSLTLVQASIPFYPESVGEELEGALALVNSGTRPLRATITCPSGFVVAKTKVDLAPGADPESVAFSFRAPQVSDWSARIKVAVDGGDTVYATVLCEPRPDIRLAEDRLTLTEGDRGPFTVTLRHSKGGPAHITGIRTRDGELEVLDEGGYLEPGGELAVKVQFPGGAPAPLGDGGDTLELELLNLRSVRLPLVVIVQEPPRLDVIPPLLGLGTVLVGHLQRRGLQVINRGGGPLVLQSISLIGADSQWQLEGLPPMPHSIRRSAQLDFALAFRAHQGGGTRATVQILSNDPARAEMLVIADADVKVDPEVYEDYVGIDFGTTNSCICVPGPRGGPLSVVFDDTQPVAEDRVTVPSWVYWPRPPSPTPEKLGADPSFLRDCLVGREARDYVENPRYALDTALSVKRLMGQRETLRIHGVALRPEDVAARIIRHLVDAAEDHIGKRVKKAVVTVPANFTPPQVRATIRACELAGLDAEVATQSLMDEPVGAAVDYLSVAGPELGDNFHVLVYDFGGGTLDVSIIHFRFSEGRPRIRVIASKGDTAFGGDDLTEALRRHLHQAAEAQTGSSIPADPPAQWASLPDGNLRAKHVDNYVHLRELADNWKCRLSSADRCEGPCKLWVRSGRDFVEQSVVLQVARSTYEELIGPLIKATRRLVTRALDAAHLREDQIPLVLLVGKSSRTPLVGRLLHNWFGLEPVLHDEPKVCVSRGAYRKGEMLLLPGDVSDLLRELDHTNCQYGIIVQERLRKVFKPLINEGVKFPAETTYPSNGQRLSIPPRGKVVVALNRGTSDRPDDNPEIAQLGAIVVTAEGGEPLPLQVVMRVPNHRSIKVEVRAGDSVTTGAVFEEY